MPYWRMNKWELFVCVRVLIGAKDILSFLISQIINGLFREVNNMERTGSSSSIHSDMSGSLDKSGKDSSGDRLPYVANPEPSLFELERLSREREKFKVPTEPKPLCGRVITYICIPVVFIVGTVVAPIIELGYAAFGFGRSLLAALICPFCAPCVLIPGIIVFAVDAVGGVVHGLFTGGYRLVMKTLDPDNYEYSKGRFPSLSDKYLKSCDEARQLRHGNSFV